jgi:hypothetical protein
MVTGPQEGLTVLRPTDAFPNASFLWPFGTNAVDANALFASGTRVLPPVPVYCYNYPPFEKGRPRPASFPRVKYVVYAVKSP